MNTAEYLKSLGIKFECQHEQPKPANISTDLEEMKQLIEKLPQLKFKVNLSNEFNKEEFSFLVGVANVKGYMSYRKKDTSVYEISKILENHYFGILDLSLNPFTVLFRLAQDAYRANLLFEDWCRMHEYISDPEEAIDSYQMCLLTEKKLKRLNIDIDYLYNIVSKENSFLNLEQDK